jgi:hypothetical protein
MDTKQDMQATGATRGLPIASPPRTSPRPQPHRSGCGQQTPLCAVYVHSPCAVRCLPHDPTASFTPGRICKLSIPLGGSPPASRYRPHDAVKRSTGQDGRSPCVSTPTPQHCACLATTPRHGYSARHAGYLSRQEAAHHSEGTTFRCCVYPGSVCTPAPEP